MKKEKKRRHRATEAKENTRLGTQLITLYRAFLYAEAANIPWQQMVDDGHVPFWRARFVAPVPETGVKPALRKPYEEKFGRELGEREVSFINQGAFLVLTSWALLYVVIEGWKELREIFPDEELWFPPIDELLADEDMVRRLKDHRDITMHVQEKNTNERSLDFWRKENDPILTWIQEVRLAFEYFFAKMFHADKPLTLLDEHDPSKDKPWTARLLELSPIFHAEGASRTEARTESIAKAVLAFGKLWDFTVVDRDGESLYTHVSDISRDTGRNTGNLD